MGLVYFSLVLILLISTFCIGNMLFGKCTLLKNITIALSIFLAEYYAASIFFLWIDKFDVLCILKCMTILNVGILLFNKEKIVNKHFKIMFDKHDAIVMVIIALLIPFILTKSEDIRTSSDMGMYFEKAIVLMGEDTGKIKTLDEVHLISENVDDGVLELQGQLFGIYVRGTEGGKTFYDYHSLPTWVTILALHGKIFGLKQCAQALSILYVIALLCAYFCCENIARTVYGKYIAIAILALSPVIMYVSKATLTEIAFTAVFLSGCMWLSEKEKKPKFLSASYFSLLGFIHISMYMYMPILIIVLMYLFIIKKERIYAYVNILTTVLYMVSIFYCYEISHMYTRDQLLRFTFLGDSLGNVVMALIGIFTFAILIQVLLLMINDNAIIWLSKICNQIIPIIIILSEVAIIAGAITIGYNLAFTDTYSPGGGSWHLRSGYVGQGWAAIRHLNMINILKSTGVISIPIIFLYSLLRKNKHDVIENCLYLICLYSTAIFTFVQIDTPNNYYASRYFVIMIIPSVSLLMARIINTSIMTKMAFVWIICFNLYFDRFFIGRGSFAGQYQLMEEVLNKIPERAIVLVRPEDKSLNQTLVNNLREVNSNMVFNYRNMDEIKQFYDDKPLYFITCRQFDLSIEPIWHKDYTIMGNLGGGDGKYMTEEISTYSEEVYIYIINE